MFCARFLNYLLLSCFIIALIDDIIALNNNNNNINDNNINDNNNKNDNNDNIGNKPSFDKSLLTEQKWNFSLAIELGEKLNAQTQQQEGQQEKQEQEPTQEQKQQELEQQQQQELQHHQFALQPKQHHHPTSAICGKQQQQQQQQHHHDFIVLNCNAINVMADNFPNEIQNDIENEIQSEKRDDLLSKNVTAGTKGLSVATATMGKSSTTALISTTSSSSSLSTSNASVLLTLSKTAESSLTSSSSTLPSSSSSSSPSSSSSSSSSSSQPSSSSSTITSLSISTPRALARVTSTTATSSSTSASWSPPPSPPPAAVAKTTPPLTTSSSSSSVTTTTTLRPLLVASSSMTAETTPALPLNFKLNRILSRRKRFIAFPEGSSLSVAVCFTVGIIGNPRYNYMAFGLNWGVSYDLPNTSWILNHLHGFSRHPVPATVLRRRTRRSLYKEIEKIVDNMGYNGRECILRALCESRQYFERTKMGMIGEMLRVVFSLPKQRIHTRELRENSDIEIYDHAYRKARDIDCSQQYDCSFSLLELALGRYSTPPPGYYASN